MADPLQYPLRFKEIIRNYSFGDRWITREFAKTGLPEGERIAETWEVCDRPGSAGAKPGESSLITSGPLAGRTLHDCVETFGERLLGREMVERFGLRFPLLIKFLDASRVLGEQVHPNDELTRARGLKDFWGKTEAWYMLRVRPGATVECGNRRGVTAQELHEAILAGKSRSCMVEHAVQPGDAFLLYAGAMHYSAGGVLFYEIMQNSDITLGLSPRPDLPPEEQARQAKLAVEAVHLEDDGDYLTRPVTLSEGPNRRTFVLACRQFAVERLDLAGSSVLGLDGRKFLIVSAIEGTVRVRAPGGDETLRPGQTAMLAAGLGQATLEPQGPAAVLKSYVPDLWADVVSPLRQAGVSDEAIIALGGRTRLNPLAAMLRP